MSSPCYLRRCRWENPWTYKLFLVFVLYDKCLCFKARRRADRVVDLKVPNKICRIKQDGAQRHEITSCAKIEYFVKYLEDDIDFSVSSDQSSLDLYSYFEILFILETSTFFVKSKKWPNFTAVGLD